MATKEAAVLVELPGLNAIAQQKFDLPYEELSPSLQSHVREEAVRRAAPDLLAAVKEMSSIARSLAVALDGESKATDDSLAEIREIAQTVIALTEGR